MIIDLTEYKKNKYGAKRTLYNGVIYHSAKEAKKAFELDALLKIQDFKSYRRQEKEKLYGANGSLVAYIVVDFLIEHHDGTLEFLEVKSKGTITDAWRLKWNLLIDKYKNNPRYKFTIEY